MSGKKYAFRWPVLLLAFFLALPSFGSAVSPTEQTENELLTKLNWNLQRLATLNANLEESLRTTRLDLTEAQNSRDNSSQKISDLQNQIADLTQQLEDSRKKISDLEARSPVSPEESATLKEMQKKADDSLKKASDLFDKYKKEAETIIRSLETGSVLLTIGGIIAGGLTVYAIDHWPEIVKLFQ